jgi:hypothetical protein
LFTKSAALFAASFVAALASPTAFCASPFGGALDLKLVGPNDFADALFDLAGCFIGHARNFVCRAAHWSSPDVVVCELHQVFTRAKVPRLFATLERQGSPPQTFDDFPHRRRSGAGTPSECATDIVLENMSVAYERLFASLQVLGWG